LCNTEDQIAATGPESAKELQDQLVKQGIQLFKAMRSANRQAKGASAGRQDPIVVRNLRGAILQSIRENLCRESPVDWESHPNEEMTATATSGSGNELREAPT